LQHPSADKLQEAQQRLRSGEVGATELSGLAMVVRDLFPSFTFSPVLMEAYSAVEPDKGQVDLKRLCDRLVYINNNLRVYDVEFERSWFSGSLPITFRTRTGRDAVVVVEDSNRAQLEKMGRKQPAVELLEKDDVLIGLDRERLEGDFTEKMRQIKEARKKFTLTFAKLTMQEEPLEPKSDDEITEVRLADCEPKLRVLNLARLSTLEHLTRVPCSDQLLKKELADDGRVVIGEIARLVRLVYPNLRNTTTLQIAYKASDTNPDGSMGLKQFESMLKNLVLFHNEARTFKGACVIPTVSRMTKLPMRKIDFSSCCTLYPA
jgi:hypothetical protein